MIVCQACGTTNADGERFCGQCGAFLEWEGAVVDRAGASTGTETTGGTGGSGTAAADPPRVADRAGASGAAGTAGAAGAAGGRPPGKDAAAVSTAGPVPTGEAATTAAATASGAKASGAKASGAKASGMASAAAASAGTVTGKPAAAGTGTDATGPAGTGPTGAGPAGTGPAGAGPAGVGSTEVQPGALNEVQPGAPRRTRPVTAPPLLDRAAPRPGDLICGSCGIGNDPIRRFCRSCGASLKEAEVVRVSWWRRLLQRLFGRTTYTAGQRRQRKVRPHIGRVLRLLALIVVVALLIGFGPGLVRKAVNEVRDRTGDHVPISPSGFTASSARRGSPAARIADGKTNQYWSPTGAGTKSWVEASFGQPVRLLDIVVTPGISTRQDQFLTIGRPREIEVLATPKTGSAKTFVLTLKDAPGAQSFAVEAENVVRVRLTVKSSFGPAAKTGVAVAEVEFFGRL